MKQVKIRNGFVIARYNPREERVSGFPFGVFTKKEWSKPSFLRKAEYHFNNLEDAIYWSSDVEWVVMK